MSAAIAVQQQQQTQQAAAANNTALLGTPNLLPTLKPTTTLLQPGIGTQSNNNHNQLGNALQLAAQQPLSPAGTIVQQNMAAVALLNRLTAPNNILRPGTSQSKPIPLVEDKVDLLQFKRKEPREWNSDDVVAWILDIARRHQIPCENINLAKFASCTGPLLMLMNEQSFKEHDQNYGTLLFSEFCKLVTDENFIDEWMRSAHLNMPPGPSHQHHQPSSAVNNNQQQQIMPTITNNSMGNLLATNLALHNLATAQSLSADPGGQFQSLANQQQQQPPQASNLLLAAAAGIAAVQQQQQQKVIPSLGHLLQPPSAIAPPPSAAVTLLNLHSQQSNRPHLHAPQPIAASLSKMLQASQQHQLATANSQQITNRAGTSSSNGGHIGGSGAVIRRRDKEQPIRRNKDGRPRKRSQHTKGNKLWEFIRDALKDPRMCPSIVRWEDPAEGVFRIVESERLAYLWGQKKNNQKMTYEKLSRAMRTYYEKEILVPVPKSGLYPKKLVYKFGPSALGWKMTASIAVQARLAAAGGPQHHHHHHHM